MEQENMYVLLGAMVENTVAEKFKEKLGSIKTDEAIKYFIYAVAEGSLKLEG